MILGGTRWNMNQGVVGVSRTLAQLLYEQSFISNAWCILVLCLEATRLRQSERPKVARHIRLLNSLPVDGAQ